MPGQDHREPLVIADIIASSMCPIETSSSSAGRGSGTRLVDGTPRYRRRPEPGDHVAPTRRLALIELSPRRSQCTQVRMIMMGPFPGSQSAPEVVDTAEPPDQTPPRRERTIGDRLYNELVDAGDPALSREHGGRRTRGRAFIRSDRRGAIRRLRNWQRSPTLDRTTRVVP